MNDSYIPILTSKSRSLLHIALSKMHIDIVRYLVVEKNMLLRAEMRDISIETLVENLDTVLKMLPRESVGRQPNNGMQVMSQESNSLNINNTAASTVINSTVISSSSTHVSIDGSTIAANVEPEDFPSVNLVEDCIICFSNPIDCVVTPCGHQICCLECSENISRCPVCSTECSFIRVFRA